MRSKTGGYAKLIDPEARSFNGLQEFDTLKCNFCGRTQRLDAFVRPDDVGDFCRGQFRCGACKRTDRRELEEERLQRMEEREAVSAVSTPAERGVLFLPEGVRPTR